MCVSVSVCEMGKDVGRMNRQHDGAVLQEVFLSVVSWFLEGAVKGVRNVWLLALAQERGKADIQRREAWLKIKLSRWVCYGWLWALGKSLLLFKRGQVSPLTVWLLSKLQTHVFDAEWGPSKLNLKFGRGKGSLQIHTRMWVALALRTQSYWTFSVTYI